MRPDDVLLELSEPESDRVGDGNTVEELWNVVHVTRRIDRVYPYAKAFRLATDLGRDHKVDVFRRRERHDPPELAESFREGGQVAAKDPVTRIGAVMTRHPHVIGEGEPLRCARALMVEHGVRHLPVVRDQHLVGVVTDRDLKRALDPSLGLPSGDELFVRDVCIYETYHVAPDEPLERVVSHMAEAHIGSALVVEGTRLVGIFTATDACRVLAALLRRSHSG